MSELRPAPKPPKRKKKPRTPIRRSRVRQKTGKPRRFRARRDPDYLAWIRGLPCWCFGSYQHLGDDAPGIAHICDGPVEAAHLKSRGAGGSDFGNTIPLCRAEHQRQHRMGIKSWASSWMVLSGLAAIERVAQQYTERYDRERSVG